MAEMQDGIFGKEAFVAEKGQNTTLQTILCTLQKAEVVESDYNMVINLVRLLMNDMIELFVGLLRDILEGGESSKWMMMLD